MKLKVIKCEPHRESEVCYIDDDLKSLQKAVGGLIEFVYPFDTDVCIMCNEEGKLIPLEFSRPLLDDDNNIVDLIAGTCYIMGVTKDGGNRDLTDEEITFYGKYFKYPIEVFRWTSTKDELKDIIDFIPVTNEGRKVRAYGR